MVCSPESRGLAWPVAFGLVLALAVAPRLALGLRAPRPFGYAWDLYHEGVVTVCAQGRLPRPSDCWECYPPPLYFVSGAPLYALGRRLDGGRASGGLALLAWASMLLAGLTVYFCDRSVRLLRPSALERALALAFAAFLPCLFMGSYAAEADGLLTALMSAFFYLLLRRRLHPGAKTASGAAGLGILAGLAALTKYSGLVALPALACEELPSIARGPRRARDLLLALAAALAVCGWHYAGNLSRYGKPFLSPPLLRNPYARGNFGQRLSRYDFRHLSVEPVVSLYGDPAHRATIDYPVAREVWSSLHAQLWTDMVFFSRPEHQPWVLPQGYAQGSELTPVILTPAETPREAAYPRKRVFRPILELVLRLGFVPEALILLGMVATARRRATRPLWAWTLATAAAYGWWLIGQDPWGIKAKYALFLLPAACVWLILGLRAAARVDRRLGAVAAWALAAALAAAQAYIWMFALG